MRIHTDGHITHAAAEVLGWILDPHSWDAQECKSTALITRWHRLTDVFFIPNVNKNRSQMNKINICFQVLKKQTATFHLCKRISAGLPSLYPFALTWHDTETHHKTLIGGAKVWRDSWWQCLEPWPFRSTSSLMLSAWCHDSVHPKMGRKDSLQLNKGGGHTLDSAPCTTPHPLSSPHLLAPKICSTSVQR